MGHQVWTHSKSWRSETINVITGESKKCGTTQKRLRILGDDEIEELYSRPVFTPEDRQTVFSLSQPEKELLRDLRSVKSQAYFILQLGYFKARRQFFAFDFDEVEEDATFVLTEHFGGSSLVHLGVVDKKTKLKQQRHILELFGYRTYDANDRQTLTSKARQAAVVCGKPIYIFRELQQCLEEHRIIAPPYSFMQDRV